MRLKTKLILSYIVLITIPLVILGAGYYYASREIMLSLARDNVLEIVKKNNQVIDERLTKVKDNSLSLIVECDLFQIFNRSGTVSDLELLQTDQKVTAILNRYFSQSDDLYSVQLVTRAYLYGNKSKNTFPPAHFFGSDLYSRAVEEKGRMAWVPTYDYTHMYQLPEMDSTNLDYRYLFSGVREFNPSCVRNDTVIRPKSGSERPVLIMNFQEHIYEDIFRNSIPIPAAIFFVISENGTIVSHQDKTKLASIEASAWMDDLRSSNSGTTFVTVGGITMIACFATSSVTGWMSVALIPPSALMKDILQTINFSIITLGTSLLGLSLLFAYLISARIMSPISKLLLAINRVGGGDFNAKIKVEGKDEFGHLLYKFNTMNEKIKQLIDENYVVKLHEKETEILALNIQLNPHFLYNTLNIINWMAVYGEKEQVSKMLVSLSRMLHYTTDNRKDSTTLKDDLNWLQDYIVIMKNRFDQGFTVDFDIAPELMEASVPKLFLQPIVENAIIHGFQDMEAGGLITVYGRRQAEDIHVCVEDNGHGIEPERRKTLLLESSNNVGLKNVDKRIKLLYGSHYGIEIESEPGFGTRVILTIPWCRQSG